MSVATKATRNTRAGRSSRPGADQQALDMPSLDMQVETITAEMAAKWLERIDKQRKIRKSRILSLARDIVEGNWITTGEAFKFDTDGNFVDGQHRAHALVMADKERPGVTIQAVVIRNVPIEAMVVMDTGAARTAADQLTLKDYKNPALVASASKWVILFDREQLYGDRGAKALTHSEIYQFIQNNEAFLPIITEVSANLRKRIDAMTPATIAAVYYICWRIEPNEAHAFFEKLASGAGLDEDHPILALRSRLRELRIGHIHMPPEGYISLGIRTWNAVRQGQRTTSIMAFRRGQPIRCPQPL